jgi:hypothetical protein
MSATPIVVTKKDVKRGAWHYLKPALMILLTLPVLYVLSVGPVGALWIKFNLRKEYPALTQGVGAFYEPLTSLSNKDDTLAGRLMVSYLDLWVRWVE